MVYFMWCVLIYTPMWLNKIVSPLICDCLKNCKSASRKNYPFSENFNETWISENLLFLCREDRGGSTGGTSGTQFSGECPSTSLLQVAYVTELRLNVVWGRINWYAATMYLFGWGGVWSANYGLGMLFSES